MNGTENGSVVRAAGLGNVPYWIGCLAAVPFAAFAIYAAACRFPARSVDCIDSPVTLPLGRAKSSSGQVGEGSANGNACDGRCGGIRPRRALEIVRGKQPSA